MWRAYAVVMKLRHFAVLGCVALTVALTVIQSIVNETLADATGLRREVYSETSFGGARLADAATSRIDLAFLDEDETLPRRHFSVRWSGFWYLPEASTVELNGEGDDRLDVWVNGDLVLERRPGSQEQVPSVLTLDAGGHVLRIDYQQYGGDAAVDLNLTFAHEPGRQPLSSQQLFWKAPDLRLIWWRTSLRPSVPLVWAALLVLLWTRLAIAPEPGTGTADRRSIILAVVAYTVAIGIFVKNAWVAEDAYIVFRSVEQLFAGNGPVWNPHERVQAFTSPLWFGPGCGYADSVLRPVSQRHPALRRTVASHRQESSAPCSKQCRLRFGRSAVRVIDRLPRFHEFRSRERPCLCVGHRSPAACRRLHDAGAAA